ncbi:hypothetical protein Tco_1286558 [Tanacetum coccineum]
MEILLEPTSNKLLVEKTDRNAEFHEIMDFFTRSSIHYALTVSLVVSTTFVEQFWMSAKSKTINNVRYITVTVAGKPVTISEASIRSDLLFDDADWIDTLNNQAIFDTIQLMGYEGGLTVLTFNKALFSPQWKFLFHTMNHCISSKSTSWDQISTNIATTVICLLKNVPVPLDHFPINTLTNDEGEALERPFESQPIPSPSHPSEDQPESQPDPSLKPSPSIPIPDSNPEGSGGNHGGQSSSDKSLSGNEDGLTLQSVYDLCVSLCKQVIIQVKEIKDLKAQLKKLKKKARPVITHHKTWMKRVSIKTRLIGKKSMQKKWMQKASVSKQGRKTAKSKPTAHKDQTFDVAFDDLDAMHYMGTEDAHNEKGISTEDQVSTVNLDEGTDKPKVSTDQLNVSTDKLDEGTVEPKNGNSDENATPIATPTVFGDDETIAKFLVSMSQNKAKQKRVEIKDAEDSDRPRPTSTRLVLTLKPLPKIDLSLPN